MMGFRLSNSVASEDSELSEFSEFSEFSDCKFTKKSFIHKEPGHILWTKIFRYKENFLREFLQV